MRSNGRDELPASSTPDRITITDEDGRQLECFVEQSFEFASGTYWLLRPVDAPISILAWDEGDPESGAILIENDGEMDRIFENAKAVLAEQDLQLQRTAYTPTAIGDLPDADDCEILTLEIDEDDVSVEPEDFQLLANFYHNEEAYGIYTPLTPMLFLAQPGDDTDEIKLLSLEEFRRVQPLLEEWMFAEGDD